MVKDYTFSVTYEGEREGKNIVEISCFPKKNAAVVWGKVDVVVYRDNYIPSSIIYYDEDLHLSRTLNFTNIQMMGGKKIPTQMIMIPVDEPGESTAIQWEKIQFGLTINDDFFSLRKLQQ